MLSYKTSLLPGCLLAFVLAATLAPAPVSAKIVYVKPGSEPTTENGQSWPTAWNTLQEALLDSNTNDLDQIWVSKGTCKAGSSYGDSFVFDGTIVNPKRLRVYGGLTGTETTQEFNPPTTDHRDFLINETILSGDLDGTTHSQVIVSFVGVNSDWRLDGFTLEGCRSYLGDEGHAIKCDTGDPLLANLLIRSNTSSNGGAGLFVSGLSNPTIQHCTFYANAALPTQGSASGGAIKIEDGVSLTVEDSVLFGNESIGDGGAVYSNCTTYLCSGTRTATFRRCAFTSNHAWAGNGGAVYTYATTLELHDCLFEGNFASVSGGGVYCEASPPNTTGEAKIAASHFKDNVAYGSDGGGVCVNAVTAYLVNCQCIGNVALRFGGGVYAEEVFVEDPNPAHYAAYLTNCLLAGNRAGEGGGLYYHYVHETEGPLSALINCTVVGNHAVSFTGGAALIADYGDDYDYYMGPEVTNTIFWDNTDGEETHFNQEAAQIDWWGWLAPPEATYCHIKNLQCLTDPTNFGDDTDLDNPDFRHAESGDYRLQSSSPCMDSGWNDAVPWDSLDVDDDGLGGQLPNREYTPDLDLHLRIAANFVDRGCYEVLTITDCNHNQVDDATDIDNCPENDPSCHDCNNNGAGDGIPDGCNIADGTSRDCNGNGVPDDCPSENIGTDCNRNCQNDDDDIDFGYSADSNDDRIPDECQVPLEGFWTGDLIPDDPLGRVDFDLGTLINVNHDAASGELQRNPVQRDDVNNVPGTSPLPYVWVPATGRGTVVRINTDTGAVEGEYWTTPGNLGSQPSRSVIDLDGSAWIANRNDSHQGPQYDEGSVVKIGLVIGGTRVNAAGAVDPDGEYLMPPFDYCACEDRDADGRIHTSRGFHDALAWSNASSEDSDGGVTTAEDECVLRFLRPCGSGSRTVAIDRANDIWIGSYDTRVHEHRDGEGENERFGLPILNLPAGGYGGFVAWTLDVDVEPHIWRQFLWSEGRTEGLLRLDTNQPTSQWTTWVLTLGNYGLGFDPRTGRIWQSSDADNTLYEINPMLPQVNGEYVALHEYAQPCGKAKGVAADSKGNVWLASYGSTQIIRYRTPDPCCPDDSHHLPDDVPGANDVVTGFDGTTGLGIDAAGRVWVTEESANRVSRYDPDTQTILHVDLGQTAAPYSYSDMTGLVTLHTTGAGTWSVAHDSRHPGAVWCQVRWNDPNVETCGTDPWAESLVVEVRAADDMTALPGVPYKRVLYVNNDYQHLHDITGCHYIGRYIQVRVRFHGSYPGQTFATPSLCNLRVVPAMSCNVLKGDINDDAHVNGLDIQSFVNLALRGDPFSMDELCQADMNYDGAVNTADIPCFIQLLLTGTSSCSNPCVQGIGGGVNGDCNNNGIPDANDILSGTSQDCNKNWIPDECDINPSDPDNDGLVSADTDADGIPDECELDCNGNGRPDDADIACGGGNTCGGIAGSYDRNSNGIPDDCEPDCNKNGIPDSWDIAQATSADCNQNGRPDECEIDCNGNDIPDDCDVDPSDPDGDTIVWADCNTNGLPDVCDLSWPPPRGSTDCNSNEIPDECDIANCPSNDPSCQDCNANGIPDACDIAAQISLDENEDGIPDECQVENRLGGEGLPGEGLFGGFGPPFEDSEAWRAAWAEYFEWTRQQTWGPNSEYTGSEQFQRMAAKLQELGLPVRAWRR